MLGIKPFLSLEEGEMVPMEKVRTRPQAVEKMVEFVLEFSDIQQMGLIHSGPRPTDETRALLEQLSQAFPEREWPVLTYGPALATYLGPDAMGVIVCESDIDPERLARFEEDDFDEDD
jgi:fatty acid-binding protein DegV